MLLIIENVKFIIDEIKQQKQQILAKQMNNSEKELNDYSGKLQSSNCILNKESSISMFKIR